MLELFILMGFRVDALHITFPMIHIDVSHIQFGRADVMGHNGVLPLFLKLLDYSRLTCNNN